MKKFFNNFTKIINILGVVAYERECELRLDKQNVMMVLHEGCKLRYTDNSVKR